MPAALQQKVAATLAICRSFGTAVRESGVLADLVEEQVAEAFDDHLDGWLREHGLDRKTIEDQAERPPATPSALLGLTQKQLAATLGVAPMTVARCEQGVNPVSPLARTSLTLLAQMRGLSVPAAGRRRGRPSARRS